jgi:GNAT superfamily N-acetyltransferase
LVRSRDALSGAAVTATIRPARADDIEQVVALLSKMSAKVAPERWRRLFAYPWRPDNADFGRVAVNGDRVVGFVGMVHADRTVDGRRERIVNICAWYLDKAHRGRGLGAALMRRATDDPAMTYTILTSSSKTLHILAAVGYRVLDDQRRIWRPRRSGASAAVRIEREAARIMPHLGDAQRRLLADHAGLPVVSMLVGAKGENYLAVLAPSLKAGRRRYWDLLHVSDVGLFAATAQDVADVLIGRDENAVLAADLRFIAGDDRNGEREHFAVPRFFKSSRLARRDIDNLYSEVQLLDLKLD